MLAVLLIIFAIFGLFLNWPTIVSNEFFIKLTSQLGILTEGTSKLAYKIFGGFSQGITRLDGAIVLGVSIIILITIFLHTTNKLIYFRIFVIGLTSILLLSEVSFCILNEFKIYRYGGLLYTSIFFFLAFFASVLKIGSKKSLNSTIQGFPTSEVRSYIDDLKDLSKIVVVKLTFLSRFSDKLGAGDVMEFKGEEVKIGRDSNWADLVVGEEWEAVSRRHGILEILEDGSVYYNPVSKKYAFSVDGEPSTDVMSVPSGSVLNLVSGYGPELRISYGVERGGKNLSDLSIIARREFKKLQFTVKLFVSVAILGLPIFGFFVFLQNSSWKKELVKINNEKVIFRKNLRVAQSELLKKKNLLEKVSKERDRIKKEVVRFRGKVRGLVRNLKKKKEELSQLKEKMEEEIKKREEEIKALKEQNVPKEEVARLEEELKKKEKEMSEKISSLEEEVAKREKKIKELEDKLKKTTGSKDASELLRTASKYFDKLDYAFLDADIPPVFPILTVNEDGVGSGTGFFARLPDGSLKIFTVIHVVGNKDSINFLGISKKYARDFNSFVEEIERFALKLKKKGGNFSKKDLYKTAEKGVFILDSKSWSKKYSQEVPGDGIAWIDFGSIEGNEEIKKFRDMFLSVSYGGEIGNIIGIIGYPGLNGVDRQHTEGFITEKTDNLFYASIQSFEGYSGSPVILMPLKEGDDPLIVGIEEAIGAKSSGRSTHETRNIIFRLNPSAF